MDREDLARGLPSRGETDEQVTYRIAAGDDIDGVRCLVRKLARAWALPTRTAVLGDVMVVVRADATIWSEPTAIRRQKLTRESSRPGVGPQGLGAGLLSPSGARIR